jgi:hypothetical protein
MTAKKQLKNHRVKEGKAYAELFAQGGRAQSDQRGILEAASEDEHITYLKEDDVNETVARIQTAVIKDDDVPGLSPELEAVLMSFGSSQLLKRLS